MKKLLIELAKAQIKALMRDIEEGKVMVSFEDIKSTLKRIKNSNENVEKVLPILDKKESKDMDIITHSLKTSGDRLFNYIDQYNYACNNIAKMYFDMYNYPFDENKWIDGVVGGSIRVEDITTVNMQDMINDLTNSYDFNDYDYDFDNDFNEMLDDTNEWDEKFITTCERFDKEMDKFFITKDNKIRGNKELLLNISALEKNKVYIAIHNTSTECYAFTPEKDEFGFYYLQPLRYINCTKRFVKVDETEVPQPNFDGRYSYFHISSNSGFYLDIWLYFYPDFGITAFANSDNN
jgi:hypothetical protein